jgi:MSHA biogenesis protein MshI
MRFFSKTKKPGWMAVNFLAEGVCIAHINRPRGAKPEVTLCAKYRLDSSDAAALDKAAKDTHLARYNCTTLLGSNDYQMLLVEAPNVPPDEMKTAIRWRIKDMLDYHIDDATIDVLDIPPDKNAAARTHSMYAIAARNELVRSRVALFENAHVPLAVIDIAELAQRNIAVLLEQEGRGLALLAFDADGGLLTISFNGELYLSRRLDVTLAQLLDAVDEQHRAHHFERITLELQRSLDHFDRQFHFIALSRLVIATLPDKLGLKESLAANLYVPVENLDLGDLLDLSKVPELSQPDRQALYFHTLGAALRLEEKAL